MPLYMLEAGRCITRDGVPIATIDGVRPDGWKLTIGSAAELDRFAHAIVALLNAPTVTVRVPDGFRGIVSET